jgi:ribosomal protein S18 acetylase RimI-like enzyme
MRPANEPLIQSPPTNGTLTLISGGEFCASRGIGGAVASVIPWMIQRFISSFLILRGSRWRADVCIFNAPDEAQVRFIAVDENARGRGYGSHILEGLEAEATRRGAQKLVLNARDNVTEFYAKHDYEVVGEAETLFGVIRHVRMEKILS